MTRWQRRLSLITCLAAVAALAAGCPAAPPQPVTPKNKPPAPPHVLAISPLDMATDASRRPTLQWKLPANFTPTIVSLTIYDVGHGEQPLREKDDERELAFISGVSTDSPNNLDPFSPPASTVETGDLRGMKQLAPMTWYKWKVRANTGTEVFVEDEFYFRTGTADVPSPSPTHTLGIEIPPLPEPLPPQPIDKADKTLPPAKVRT